MFGTQLNYEYFIPDTTRKPEMNKQNNKEK